MTKSFRHSIATKDTIRKVQNWETWTCNDPVFHHAYDKTVSLYVQEGGAKLTFDTGEYVELTKGDFLTIYEGSEANWDIPNGISNRYQYHDSFVSASHRQEQIHWDRK
ncbi:cupin domain-containing protein [Curvivirga sp.]|uniref:cupin domain-containing protein n=1 Tax=Curvivirga sp. TaxID=2856848 RepID=UPI003B5CBFDA